MKINEHMRLEDVLMMFSNGNLFLTSVDLDFGMLIIPCNLVIPIFKNCVQIDEILLSAISPKQFAC